MADQPVQSAGEMMIFGLMEQADRIGQSVQATQRDLAAQVQQLGKVQAGIQTAIQELAAERVALGTIRPTLANYAAKAMREAIAAGNQEIKAEAQIALRQPLLDMQKAAHHVRDNVKETRWLLIAAYVMLGMVLGLALGYLPVRSDLNALTGHVNQIDNYLAAQQPQPATSPAPGTPQPGKKHGQH